MEPSFTHKRQSANVATYGEKGRDEREPGYTWVSVIHNSLERDPKTKELVLRKVPTYHFTIYQYGEGEIGSFVYEPKTKPNPQSLRDRTVTRLVRAYLKG